MVQPSSKTRRQKPDGCLTRREYGPLPTTRALKWIFSTARPACAARGSLSERATDRENLDKLLAALRECGVDRRTARFRCVVVMKVSASEELVASGVCEGAIGLASRGTDGFGYDPVFVPRGHSRTFAEIDALTKNAISHRGRALAALRRMLDERFGKNLAHA